MDYEKPEAVAPNTFQHSVQQTVEPDVEVQQGFGDTTPQKDRQERRGDSLWSEPYLQFPRLHLLTVKLTVPAF